MSLFSYFFGGSQKQHDAKKIKPLITKHTPRSSYTDYLFNYDTIFRFNHKINHEIIASPLENIMSSIYEHTQPIKSGSRLSSCHFTPSLDTPNVFSASLLYTSPQLKKQLTRIFHDTPQYYFTPYTSDVPYPQLHKIETSSDTIPRISPNDDTPLSADVDGSGSWFDDITQHDITTSNNEHTKSNSLDIKTKPMIPISSYRNLNYVRNTTFSYSHLIMTGPAIFTSHILARKVYNHNPYTRTTMKYITYPFHSLSSNFGFWLGLGCIRNVVLESAYRTPITERVWAPVDRVFVDKCHDKQEDLNVSVFGYYDKPVVYLGNTYTEIAALSSVYAVLLHQLTHKSRLNNIDIFPELRPTLMNVSTDVIDPAKARQFNTKPSSFASLKTLPAVLLPMLQVVFTDFCMSLTKSSLDQYTVAMFPNFRSTDISKTTSKITEINGSTIEDTYDNLHPDIFTFISNFSNISFKPTDLISFTQAKALYLGVSGLVGSLIASTVSFPVISYIIRTDPNLASHFTKGYTRPSVLSQFMRYSRYSLYLNMAMAGGMHISDHITEHRLTLLAQHRRWSEGGYGAPRQEGLGAEEMKWYYYVSGYVPIWNRGRY